MTTQVLDNPELLQAILEVHTSPNIFDWDTITTKEERKRFCLLYTSPSPRD